MSKQVDILKKTSTDSEQEMSPGREIHSMSNHASPLYKGRSHVVLPRQLIGEYVEAMIESQKDDPNAIRITHFVTRFGNSGHLLLPEFFTGHKILVIRKGTTEKEEKKRLRMVGDKE